MNTYVLILGGLVAIGLSWLLPWHFVPWLSFQQEALMAFGAGMVALGALGTTGRDRPVRLPRLAWLLAAIAVVPAVQWAAGQIVYRIDALLSASFLLAAAFAAWAAATLMRCGRRSEWVGGWFAAVGVAAFASTGIGLVQWLDIGAVGYVADLAPGSRVYANLTQPNHLATLLGMGLVSVVWAYEARRIGGLSASLGLGFLGFGLLMTQSRTGAVFVAALAAWMLAMRSRVGLRTRPSAVVIALALLGLGVVVWNPLNEALLLSAGPTLDARLSPGTRLIHWRAIWDAIWLKPWVGYGWGQVTFAQSAVAAHHPSTAEWLLYSHNIVLDVLAWNGVPLGVLILAAIALWGVQRVVRCTTLEGWAMLAAAGAIVTHAFLEYPLAYAYFTLPLGLMLGSAEGAEADSPANVRPHGFARPAIALTIGAQLALLGWIGVEYIKVEEAARGVRFHLMGILSPDGKVEPPPDVVLLDQLRDFHWLALAEARPDMTDAELDRMRKAVRRRPIPPVLMRYALACALNGRPDEAIDALSLIRPLYGEGLSREGRADWAKLEEKYPQLRAVPFPDGPAAPASGSRASASL